MDRTDLPIEAVKIDGSYIEDLIPGYTTVITSGREALEAEAEWYENTGADGSKILRTRMPARTIKIDFVIHGTSLTDMRSKLRKLNRLLDIREAQFIFNDEPDCYFTGKPTVGDNFSNYTNACMGSWSILCEDPYKYSTAETTVPLTTRTDTITDEEGNTSTVTSRVFSDNNTGCKVYPVFDVAFATDEQSSGSIGTNADCGYVLFAKGGTDYSVQIGDDSEADIVQTTPVNQNFSKGLGGFAANNSITPRTTNYAHQGSIKYQSAENKGTGMKVDSFGTTVSGKYFGPLAVKDIGQNITGGFKLTWKQVLACASDTAVGKKQRGSFWVYLLDANNVPLYGFGVNKKNTSKLTGAAYFYSQESGQVSLGDISLKYTGALGFKNKSDTSGRKATNTIERYQDNGEWRVKLSGIDTLDLPDGETAKTVRKIAFFFGKYGSNAFKSNRVTTVKIINGDYDQVNTFGSGDSVTVDCGKAEIICNGKVANELGDYGNNWEDMYLDAGANVIYVQYSDWINQSYLPTVTMKYRRRWL